MTSAGYSVATVDNQRGSLLQKDDQKYAAATVSVSRRELQSDSTGVSGGSKITKSKKRPLKAIRLAQRRATTPSVFRVVQEQNSVQAPQSQNTKSRQN